MTQAISSCESSCLANCRSVHVSVHLGLFSVQSIKEVLKPVASALLLIEIIYF